MLRRVSPVTAAIAEMIGAWCNMAKEATCTYVRTSHIVYLFLLVVSLGGTTVAYQISGFLGIGVLGLIIGVIALTVEIERGGPIGHDQATGLYSST